MHNLCGKAVQFLRKAQRKTSAILSTEQRVYTTDQLMSRVQPTIIRSFVPRFPQYISTIKMTVVPLIEHYLYPVSTAPITTATKRI